MLSLILHWLLVLPIVLAVGRLAVRLGHGSGSTGYGLVDYYFMGFAVTGFLVGVVSLFRPLSVVVFLVFFVMSAIWLVYDRKWIELIVRGFRVFSRLSRLMFLPLILVIIIILLYSLLPALHIDTGLYHWHAMRWAEEYAVVPGLANLNERFGFNSNASLMHGFFSFQDIPGYRVIGLNSLTLIVLFVWLVKKVRNQGTGIRFTGLILMGMSFLFCYGQALSSPATDLLPNVFVAYLLLRYLLGRNDLERCWLLYFVVPAYAVTMKLSAFPVCTLGVIAAWRLLRGQKYRQLLVGIVGSMVVLLLWCVRNVLISGYLIYPLPAIDLFQVDWKVPMDTVVEEYNWIKTYPRKVIGVLANRAIWEEWFFWIKSRFHLSQYPVLLTWFLALLSPGMMACKWVEARRFPRVFWVWIISYFGFLYCFLTAPDERFCLGFVFVAAVSPIFLFGTSEIAVGFTKKYCRRVLYAGMCMALCGRIWVAAGQVWEYRSHQSVVNLIVHPVSMRYYYNGKHGYYWIKDQVRQINGLDIYWSYQCLECPLPCVSVWSDGLEPRGRDVQSGFRTKK